MENNPVKTIQLKRSTKNDPRKTLKMKKNQNQINARIFGDGLVHIESALGQHKDTQKALPLINQIVILPLKRAIWIYSAI